VYIVGLKPSTLCGNDSSDGFQLCAWYWHAPGVDRAVEAAVAVAVTVTVTVAEQSALKSTCKM